MGISRMTRTGAELKIGRCNYIVAAKSAKIILEESNLYGIEFSWIQVIKQTAQTTIPFDCMLLSSQLRVPE